MRIWMNFFYGNGYGIAKPVPAPPHCHLCNTTLETNYKAEKHKGTRKKSETPYKDHSRTIAPELKEKEDEGSELDLHKA